MKSEVKIAICDDETILIFELKKRILEYEKEHNFSFRISEFLCSKELMERLAEFDIVILDICMPDENGIQIAERIRESGISTELVFHSSHPEYAMEGYHVNACGFIVKGDTKERFEREFDHVMERYLARNYRIELETAEGTVFRNISDLLYTKYANRELEYFWHDGTTTLLRGTMKNLENLAKDKKLIQINKNTMVNPAWIERCFGGEIQISHVDETMKVSRRRWKEVEQEYLDYNRNYIR